MLQLENHVAALLVSVKALQASTDAGHRQQMEEMLALLNAHLFEAGLDRSVGSQSGGASTARSRAPENLEASVRSSKSAGASVAAREAALAELAESMRSSRESIKSSKSALPASAGGEKAPPKPIAKKWFSRTVSQKIDQGVIMESGGLRCVRSPPEPRDKPMENRLRGFPLDR